MNTKALDISDRPIITDFLRAKPHELSYYSFTNIFIWKKLFYISWTILDSCLCVFFSDKSGIFLYLPPLGACLKPETVDKLYSYMNSINKNPAVSRLENIEDNDSSLYSGLGYKLYEKPPDFICTRDELVNLRGNKFKSQRAGVNHFLKNRRFVYREYRESDRVSCLYLYNKWQSKKHSSGDRISAAMARDSLTSLETLLENYDKLSVAGRVILTDGALAAFSFGYELSQDTFCILFEIADTSVRGINQYIFKKFCEDLSEYDYINIMDDSGLENLNKTKKSYHPVKYVKNLIASFGY